MEDIKTVRGHEFSNEAVEVDGTEFIDCTFDNCTLVYRGGAPFILAGPGGGNVQITFEDAAANTLNTLRAMHRFGYDGSVEQIIRSIRNPFDAAIN